MVIDETMSSPRDRRWRWEQSVPLRWLLVDEDALGRSEAAVAVCSDIDGLFVDRQPLPPVERYTLLGCAPAGRLRAAMSGTDGAWLGNVLLEGVHHLDRPPLAGCDRVPVGCWACTEELLDLTVIGQQPSVLAPGRVDIEVEGRVRTDRRDTPRTLAEPPDVIGYRLTGDGELVECVEVAGVFRQRPEPPRHLMTLLGCRPEPPLQAALEALRRGAGNPGGALHRRRISASILSVAADGTAVPTLGGGLHGSVTAVLPSPLGEGLLNVTFDTAVDAMPSGARQIWEGWRAGPRQQFGEWIGYDRVLRHEWAGAALCHRRSGLPDQPAGTTYHLDGRYVTNVEGFYCAIGEAVNGPGGYFGWNLSALDDCLRGGWGATPPFRLVWHDSAVASAHLLPGYDRDTWSPAITLDDLLHLLTHGAIQVELR